ncbi:hypothetical protein N7493_009717 [Penicillium malachiteum]|uniref:C2H2-type domain-containing protein n=1 Tax=Penicillium malachiteum TaxID=1324776 RepID=A0AAD6HF49_9EURO|nr:hypothetical protein N7493_009717 [Penicillium malachiteum]
MAPSAPGTASNSPAKKTSAPEKKYKCQFCNRAFSRSEHRSRHERSPHSFVVIFYCAMIELYMLRMAEFPLVAEGRRRGGGVQKSTTSAPSKPSITIDPATLEQIEASSDGMVDLETAAMLMTDFQHKAAAAANGQVSERSESLSPAHGSFEPYLTGNATLPQMPWDTLVSPAEPGSMPTLDRHGPVGDVLLSNSLPMSGNSTPNALSPYPSMTGPVSPVNYRRSPGPSQALTLPKAPQLANEMERNQVVERVQSADTLGALPDNFQLPATAALNRYLSTYFNLYHPHLPFLHQQSFNPATVSAPLLLAVLSIGALYTFEREHAFLLHVGSKVLVNQFLQHKDNFDSRKCPLWLMQSSLLNMVFESWSGDPKGLEWTCSIKSLLANMVAGNRYQLKLRTDARQGMYPSRAEWIEDESCRRTYFAVYIFFGMLTLTFNHTPAMSFDEFDNLELPSSESLWNLDASDEESWRRTAKSNTLTVREAHDFLFQGEQTRYSAFATRVLINALFLQVWNHKRSFEALQDVVTEYKLRLALETWESSLDVCEPETIVVPLSTPQKGHPLIFNSMAVYRNTRARLEVDLKSIQEAMRYHSSYEVAAAMTVAREKVKRSQEMNKVVQQCFECIEIAAIQGINWVAKTSATNWSVEHPLCGLDLMVILSLWLYRLEHDDEPATEAELAIYNKVRNLFDDDAIDAFGKLSSTVARVWGNILDGVVVWGITKLMGESFKLHSQALVGYEDSLRVAKDQPIHAVPPKSLASVGTAY